MIYTHHVKQFHSDTCARSGRVAITLPGLPGLNITADRSETDPTALPIRKENRPGVKGLAGQKFIDYAEGVEWNCTIAEAAEAVGITLHYARSVTASCGITHKFKGHMPGRQKARLEVQGSSAGGHIGAMNRGYSFDENQIPLDVLFKGRGE